jgi:hypothetical protein
MYTHVNEMDYNKRSSYKLLSYAEIFESVANIHEECPLFAAAIMEFIEKQIQHYFGNLKILLQDAEKIWADKTGDTLDCLMDLKNKFAIMEEVAHRAFITAYMQIKIRLGLTKRQLADYYIDQYEDENGPHVGLVHSIAKNVPCIEWTPSLKGRDHIIKRIVLEYLQDNLHDIWICCGIQKREIERLIKYGY